jgi:hypothetical protein
MVMNELTFADWWHDTGSQLTPLPHADLNSHAERASKLAWITADMERRTRRDELDKITAILPESHTPPAG